MFKEKIFSHSLEYLTECFLKLLVNIWVTDLAFVLFPLIISMFFKEHSQQIYPQAS